MRTSTRGTLAAALLALAGCSLSIDPESVKAPGPKTPAVSWAAVAPDSVPFSFGGVAGDAAPTAKAVRVTNAGGGTLATPAVSLSGAGATWLDYTVSGPTGGPFTISFQPKAPLPAAGTYSTVATVTCAAATNPTFTVNVSLTTTAAPPILGITPAITAFVLTEGSGGTQDQTFTIRSTNATPLSGVPGVSSGAAWLTVASGPTANGSGGYTVTIRAAVGPRTAAGSPYGGTLTITSSGATGSPMAIPVSLQVTSPTNPSMTLSPSPFPAFSGVAGSGAASTPASAVLTVTNSVGTLADPTASDDAAWLTVSAANKLATNQYEFTLTPDITGLVKGAYTANVTVSSANAVPASVTFQVTLNITNPPTTALNPTALTFTRTGAGTWTPSTATVAVTNSGDGTLGAMTLTPTYNLGANWLSLSQAPSAGGYTVTAAPIDGGITGPGSYTANVKVQCAGATNASLATAPQFSVTYSVPGIQVAPNSYTVAGTPLTLGPVTAGSAIPATGTFKVTNAIGGALATPSFTQTPAAGSWLTVGQAADGSGGFDFTISASAAALAAGTHTGTITISSPGAYQPRTVYVSFTVNPVVVTTMTISPASPLTFTAGRDQNPSAPTQALTVTYSAGSPGAPTAAVTSAGTSWLTVDAITGSGTQYTVPIRVTSAALAVGGYTGTVRVTAPAGVTPTFQDYTVNLQVNAPAVGGCIASSGRKVCASAGGIVGTGGITAGGAGQVSTASRVVKKSTVTAGASPRVQTANQTIRASVLVPGNANP